MDGALAVTARVNPLCALSLSEQGVTGDPHYRWLMPEFTPGDAIMLGRPDGTWDVFLVDVNGEADPWMDDLKTEGIAYEVARTAVISGGRVWVCCHQTPSRIEEYCRVH